jgi:hypothetical protein
MAETGHRGKTDMSARQGENAMTETVARIVDMAVARTGMPVWTERPGGKGKEAGVGVEVHGNQEVAQDTKRKVGVTIVCALFAENELKLTSR